MKNIKKILIIGGGAGPVLLMPLIAFAQTYSDFINRVTVVINGIFPFVLTLAGVVFVWGVFKFITAAGDEEKRKEGRDFIIYALIGIVIMLSFWGLVNILLSAVGLSGATRPQTLPKF